MVGTQVSVGDGKVYIDFFTSLYIWMFPKIVVPPNHSNPWFWVLTAKDIYIYICPLKQIKRRIPI